MGSSGKRRVHGESLLNNRELRSMISCSYKLVSLLVCLAVAVNASYVTHHTPKCRTEYDTVTSYEQQCSTTYEQECSTVQEESCSPRVEKSCATVEVQECSTSYERECSTNHERQCSSRTEQQCSTV